MARKYTRDNRGRFASVGATARGGRLKTASGKKRETKTMQAKPAKAAGTIGKPRGLKPGAIKPKAQAKPAAKPEVMTPSRIAGTRKRASEKPEASLSRAKQRAEGRLRELQSQQGTLQSALRRRRGTPLNPEEKKATAGRLNKINRRIDRIKDAPGLYSTKITDLTLRKDMMLAHRGRLKAPANNQTAKNRLGTLRRRVSYLDKTEPKLHNKFGDAYDNKELAAARKDLKSQAVRGMKGIGVTLRSRSQARQAQAARTGSLIKAARKTRRGGRMGLYTKTMERSVSRQGNLLTGKSDRVVSGPFRKSRRQRYA